MIRMWCIHDNIYIVYDGPIKCDGCPMPTAFEKKGRRGRKGRMRPRPRPRTSQRPRPRPLSRFFLCFCRTHQQTASSGSIRNSSNRRAKIRVKTPARSPLVVPVSSTGVNTKRSFRICPVLRQKIQKLAIWPKPLPLPAAAAAVLPEVGRTDAEAAPHGKTHAGIPAGACAARVPPRAGTGANSGRPIPATATAAAAKKGTTCTGGRGSHSQSAGGKKPFRILSAVRSQYLLLLEHLDGVVPSHAAVGGAAADKDDLGLTFLGVHGRGAGNGAGGGHGACGNAGRAGDEGRAGEGGGGDAGRAACEGGHGTDGHDER